MQPLRSSLKQWRPPARKLSPLDAVRSVWPTLVGADIARNGFPVAIEGDVLVISTRSGTWSQQLGFLEARLIPQIQELPEGKMIARLVFRVGRMKNLQRQPPPPPNVPKQSRLRLTVQAAPTVTIEELSARIRERLLERERRLARVPRCRGCAIPVETQALCAPCRGREAEARLRQAQCVLRELPWLGANAVREMVPGLGLEEFVLARRRLQSRMEQQIDAIRWELRKGRPATLRERTLAQAYTMLVTGQHVVDDALLKHALGLSAGLFYEDLLTAHEEHAAPRRTRPRHKT